MSGKQTFNGQHLKQCNQGAYVRGGIGGFAEQEGTFVGKGISHERLHRIPAHVRTKRDCIR